MGALKAHQVSAFLDRPDIDAGVFLAYGPDAGLVRETGSRLAARLGAGGPEPADLVVLEGGELDSDPSRFAVEAGSMSLFGGRRIVRVRGAGKGLVVVLAGFAADPGDAAIVLEAGNLTPRDPLRTLVEGARFGRALPCYPDTEESLARLIADTFAAARIAIEPDAAATLRESLGNDREVTRRELEKLVIYAGENGRIGRDDVVALCADNAALVLDAICDAMASGHAADLEQALGRAAAAAVNPQQVLAATLGHVATLRRWRAQVDAGSSPAEVLRDARPRPHFSRTAGLQNQLRTWSDARLAAAAARLQTATAESRQVYPLREAIARRAVLAVCLLAAQQ
jgi:DNA polymerase-3 subunit delta